ncbi:MAG: phosphoribosylformylglycinamidine cyclo-ligase [Deltaproteobacteria bacterium]|nr:phosphoribosylformylglycinamidine cyclo-ligase [Deltaproteobacteria bacterium]
MQTGRGPRRPERALTYRDAGVDIAAGERLVDRIAPLARRTRRPEVLTAIGGFGAAFRAPRGMRDPVFVTSTDGVGTKLRFAFALDRHDTVGIDLVAMNANDVLALGAEPLVFLDYFATGRLDVRRAAAVVSGIAAGCREAGCALVGGETAEMPSFYAPGEYDLAGFVVGAVERRKLLDGSRVRPGHVLIGLASSGLHSNGYSLAHRVVERRRIPLSRRIPEFGCTLGEELLRPTRIYVKSVLGLLAAHPVHALAHITGGGIAGNLPRVLPRGSRARIRRGSWPVPAVFGWLARMGPVEPAEMDRALNQGLGMILAVPARAADAALEFLRRRRERAFPIGEIVRGSPGVDIVD